MNETTEIEAPVTRPATAREPGRASGSWRLAFLDELARNAAEGRWGRALMAVGWLHLAMFLACQAIYRVDVRSDPRHPVLWFAEVVLSLGIFRLMAGRDWWRASDAAALIVRIWGTFLILTFNLAAYNSLMGWSLDWFKAAWATLSTFGFAMLAWLIDLRFLILAVQMYFTGLLMIRFPHYNYLIYGISWWAALMGVGWLLERRRARFER
jgi:hypothetical protein